MTVVDKLLEWLAGFERFSELTPTLGEWVEGPEDAGARFLSINMESSPRPGVVAQAQNLRLYITSQRNGDDIAGAKWDAYEMATALAAYIVDKRTSSCFENVVLLAGIIGPMTTTQGRACYEINLQITT